MLGDVLELLNGVDLTKHQAAGAMLDKSVALNTGLLLNKYFNLFYFI